jgi:uncharacterized protein YneR
MEYYQIACEGHLALFDKKVTHFSRNIYVNYPSEEIINKFIEKCTTPISDCDFNYFDNNYKVRTQVVKVELIEN